MLPNFICDACGVHYPDPCHVVWKIAMTRPGNVTSVTRPICSSTTSQQCSMAFSQSWLLSHQVFVGSAAAKILLRIFVRPASNLGTQPQTAVNHLVHSTPCTCQAIVASGGVMHIVDLENAFDSALSLCHSMMITDPRVSFFCVIEQNWLHLKSVSFVFLYLVSIPHMEILKKMSKGELTFNVGSDSRRKKKIKGNNSCVFCFMEWLLSHLVPSDNHNLNSSFTTVFIYLYIHPPN